MHFLWFAKRFGVVWWAVAKSKQNKACLIVLQIIAAPGPPLPKHITPPKMKTSHQASYKVKHLKNLVRKWTGSKIISGQCILLNLARRRQAISKHKGH